MPRSAAHRNAWRSPRGSITWGQVGAHQQGEDHLPSPRTALSHDHRLHLVFFASGLVGVGEGGRNPSGWEGLWGGEPPEGISVFIKHGDRDLCFCKRR